MRSAAIFVFVCFLVSPLGAAPPLHQRIDRLIEAGAKGHAVAPISSDSEFCRRIYLDFAGRIPTVKELQKFLAEKRADKRKQLIDQLQASPEYVRRMRELFHVMLLERRADHDEWQAFLQIAFAKNMPWNKLARAILNPDANNKDTRGAALFFTARLKKVGQNPTDYPGLTRDITRLFLGQDLQCAQCHNHLFIRDYRQLDFQGLYSVYLQTSIFGGKFPAISERRMVKKHAFVSVFDPTQQATGPRIPGGKEISIPPPPQAKKGARRKRKLGPQRPKFSPVSLVAGQLTAANNRSFATNIANRLWFVMMGRGLVHPLDLHHSQNDPSHPELLQLLGKEIARHKFDMKWFFRELALTKTYQRSGRLEKGKQPPLDRFTVFAEKRMSAEQLLWSVLVATDRQRTIAPGLFQGQPKKSTRLTSLQKKFNEAFANPAKEPEDQIRPTVKGALFLLNDEDLLNLLKPHNRNLTSRLGKEKDAQRIAEQLFLAIYSRRPSAAETTEMKQYLKESKDRQNAIRQLAWALLSSAEFFTNH